MAWVTWVTWAFVAVAGVVVVVAAALSRGLLHDSFEPPYPPGDRPQTPAATPSAGRSGVGWSEPAGGWPLDATAHTGDERAADRATGSGGRGEVDGRAGFVEPTTTGEPTDGRHEAQDR